MYGNGVVIGGMATLIRLLQTILLVPKVATAVCFVVVVGAIMRLIVRLLIVASTIPTVVATLLASGWYWFRNLALSPLLLRLRQQAVVVIEQSRSDRMPSRKEARESGGTKKT
jgi:hypothetical protein